MSMQVGMPTPEDTTEKPVEKKKRSERSESLFLTRTNLLSKDSPLEANVLDFAKKINENESLTNAKQAELVRAVKNDLPYSRHNLTESNIGLLATLAYPLKAYSYDNSDELMDAAFFALMEAATQFDTRTGHNFTNFAAPIIQDALVAVAPWAEKYKLLGNDEPPIYTLIRFTSKVKEAITPEQKLQKVEQDNVILQEESRVIIRENADILQYIHLPDEVLEQQYGFNMRPFYDRMKLIRERVGALNRQSLALMCVEAEIPFKDLNPLPDVSTLSAAERKVAPLLHLSYDEVARLANLDKTIVNSISTRLRKKVNARSRTELVIMTKLAEVEPVQEALAPFTTLERRVLALINLETEDIAGQLGLSNGNVNRSIYTAAERVGVTGRNGLALYLYEHGLFFDVPQPDRPLHELFDSRQMKIIQNLHLTNKELAELDGSTEGHINELVYRLEKRVGAKNRIDLMLISRMFDTGERRSPGARTKREKLASKLGWGTLDAERLKRMLEEVTERQGVLIEAYYLSDEEVKWREVAKQYNLNTPLAMVTARTGIMRIREMTKATKEETQAV